MKSLVESLAALGAGAALLSGCGGVPAPVNASDDPPATETSSHSHHSDSEDLSSDPGSATEPSGPSRSATSAPAGGQGKGKGQAGDAPTTKKAIGPTLDGVIFGQSPKQVGAVIDKILDADYQPLYKEVQPGIKMKELDAQIAEDKSQFRRSRIEFGKLPTGLDSTPLRGEYTYNNKEAMLSFTRKGEVTYFFFIQERLWKIIVERRLGEGQPLGKTYMDSVVKLSASYGVPGRVIQPDGTTHFVLEVDWKDANTHMRAIQRGDTAVALAYEDNGTVASLASLRPNKPVVDNGIDPDVAAAIRGPSGDPGPPPDKKDKKKKKK